MQKLLINSVGERDSGDMPPTAPAAKASRESSTWMGLVLLDEDQVLSALDHYVSLPTTAQFQSITLLSFVQQYMESNTEPSKGRKWLS